ncbi:MAG: hypothetical protein HY761_05570 [Candidatus Omnitrophica bacterium]|nr:hypothetical protein [Candidatus Omnitrophota bacterium]
MRKCFLRIFLGLFILGITGIFVARSIFANKSNQADCEEFQEKIGLIRDNFNKSCNIDNDCMDFAMPYSCSLCMNKDNDISEHNKYYTEAVRKDCFLPKNCMPSVCVCKNNVCIKQRIEEYK